MVDAPPRVALLSLEPWDEVWRRNQHLASELMESGAIGSLLFVTPPRGGLAVRAVSIEPIDGVEVVTPPLIVPRRHGGRWLLTAWLRRQLTGIDLLWVNDPVAGRGAVRLGLPALYDVTDDWRSMPQTAAARAQIVAAEDLLATRAATIVCSQVLADRWQQRYDLKADLVPNGVDVAAIRSATARSLDGDKPHAVYVGTLHSNRVDLDVAADLVRVATVHLVGPDFLEPAARESLIDRGVRLYGGVPAADVPSWLVSADVLICPHVVDEFTLSLDAIKAHEYLATDRPVVATPSCGFQSTTAAGLTVIDAAGFASAVGTAVGTGPFVRPAPSSWTDRACEFALVMDRALGAGND